MRKAYIQPSAEVLSISALEEFLIGSPDEVMGSASAGDAWSDQLDKIDGAYDDFN